MSPCLMFVGMALVAYNGSLLPACPLSHKPGPGKSQQTCTDRGFYPPTNPGYCSGACTADGNLSTPCTNRMFPAPLCLGCCPKQQACCGGGCCPSDRTCCNGLGCARDFRKQCGLVFCTDGHFACRDHCCKDDLEVCLPLSGCCKPLSVCGSSCCGAEEMCCSPPSGDLAHCCKANGTCCGGGCCSAEETCYHGKYCGATSCTYDGVDITPLSSAFLGHDTQAVSGNKRVDFNPCGVLVGAPALPYPPETMAYVRVSGPTPTGAVVGRFPPTASRDARGNLVLHASSGEYYESTFTILCCAQASVTVSFTEKETLVTYCTTLPSVCANQTSSR